MKKLGQIKLGDFGISKKLLFFSGNPLYKGKKNYILIRGQRYAKYLIYNSEMLKIPVPKLKEANPLLKSLTIGKINLSQIKEEISKEEKILNNFISHCKYPEAEKCDKKISALKKYIKTENNKRNKQTSYCTPISITKEQSLSLNELFSTIPSELCAEKEHLKIDEFSDTDNLKFYYDIKLEELQAKSQATLEELKRNEEMKIY